MWGVLNVVVVIAVAFIVLFVVIDFFSRSKD